MQCFFFLWKITRLMFYVKIFLKIAFKFRIPYTLSWGSRKIHSFSRNFLVHYGIMKISNKQFFLLPQNNVYLKDKKEGSSQCWRNQKKKKIHDFNFVINKIRNLKFATICYHFDKTGSRNRKFIWTQISKWKYVSLKFQN